jgi:hypothetical protein
LFSTVEGFFNMLKIVHAGSNNLELFAPEKLLTQLIESVHNNGLREKLENTPKTMFPITYRSVVLSEETVLSILEDLRNNTDTSSLGNKLYNALPKARG